MYATSPGCNPTSCLHTCDCDLVHGHMHVMLAAAGRHGTYRGYNVAPARGLTLHEVMYDPRVDDPT